MSDWTKNKIAALEMNRFSASQVPDNSSSNNSMSRLIELNVFTSSSSVALLCSLRSEVKLEVFRA